MELTFARYDDGRGVTMSQEYSYRSSNQRNVPRGTLRALVAAPVGIVAYVAINQFGFICGCRLPTAEERAAFLAPTEPPRQRGPYGVMADDERHHPTDPIGPIDPPRA